MDHSTSVSGQAFIFHVHHCSGGYVLRQEVIKNRRTLFPEDGKIRFIQCNNVLTRRDSRGTAAAYFFCGEWRLIMIEGITTIKQSISFFICLNLEFWYKCQSWESIAHSFSDYQTMKMKNVWIIPLNQITGNRPGGMLKSKLVINEHDGMHQCSVEGPDLLLS